jgi:O-antigen/teichoic acid export membrane protein
LTDNRRFLKNIGLVALGPIIGSLVGFLAEPWVSRLWSPDLYGIGAYFYSILQFLTPALFLRYNFAIVQAVDHREAANLLALSAIIFAGFFTLITLGYPLLGRLLGGSFPFDKYKAFFLSALVAGSLAALLRFWASYHKRFGLQSAATIMTQVTPVLMLLLLGFSGNVGEWQMILIRSIAYYCYPLLLVLSFISRDMLQVFRDVSWTGIRSVALKYRDYPRHEYLGYIAGLLSFNLPVILVARYWGTEVSGLYAKAFTILYMFVLLLGDSVNRVLHKEAADIVNSGKDLAPFINNVFRALVYLSLLPFMLVILVGPELFSVFLGERWMVSGQFAQAMALWSFANLINASLMPLYGVLNKQLQYTRFTLATLAIRALILILMGMAGANVILSLAVFALANMVVLMWQAIYIVGLAGVDIKGILCFVLTRVLELLPLAVVFMVVRQLFNLGTLELIGLAALLSLPYVYLYYIRNIKQFRNLLVA